MSEEQCASPRAPCGGSSVVMGVELVNWPSNNKLEIQQESILIDFLIITFIIFR